MLIKNLNVQIKLRIVTLKHSLALPLSLTLLICFIIVRKQKGKKIICAKKK